MNIIGYLVIGKRIKEQREKLNMTQEEVATKLGITQSTYSRYESGSIDRIPPKKIESLSIILKTTVDRLIGNDSEHQLDHFPDLIKKFILDPVSVPYIAQAYRQYVDEQLNGLEKKKI